MDMLLIILVIAIIIVGLIFKDFKSEVYFIAITDILFRLLHKFIELINIKPITKLINTYIPNSLESVINYYSSGILNTVLIWVLFLLYCYFIYYLIIYWIKKRK